VGEDESLQVGYNLRLPAIIAEIPKQPPRIVGGQGTYKPGEALRVNCTSGPSRPAANLKWYINNDTVSDTYQQTGTVESILPVHPEPSSSFSKCSSR
jgi:hypothetical protein